MKIQIKVYFIIWRTLNLLIGEQRVIYITEEGQKTLENIEDKIVKQIYKGDKFLYQKKLKNWISKKHNLPYQKPDVITEEVYNSIKKFVKSFRKDVN